MDRDSVQWRGYIPALTTPFHPDGELDRSGWVELVQWAVQQGVHGIVVAGSERRVVRPSTTTSGSGCSSLRAMRDQRTDSGDRLLQLAQAAGFADAEREGHGGSRSTGSSWRRRPTRCRASARSSPSTSKWSRKWHCRFASTTGRGARTSTWAAG